MIEFMYFWRGASGVRARLPGENMNKELTLLFVGKTITLPIRTGLILVAYADANCLEPAPYYILRRNFASDEPVYGCAAVIAVDADGQFRSITDEDEADAKKALIPTAHGLMNSLPEKERLHQEERHRLPSLSGVKKRAIICFGLFLILALIGLCLWRQPAGYGAIIPTVNPDRPTISQLTPKGTDGCIASTYLSAYF